MCPIKADQLIEAWAIIPIAPANVDSIPSIALRIPDIEGTARLQVFSNSSKTQIGCFQAQIRNGNSFAHPKAISPFLALFALIAMISSFAVAIYGFSLPHMRMHYAHAFAVLIVFETYQSIFFSGALSVPWPSVLPAWWSNFAWSAGLIYVEKMADAISPFSGINGNASQVGGAGSVSIATGGGLAHQIYGRSLRRRAMKGIFRRQQEGYNASNPFDYTWGGNPATPGLPTPGTWNGFAGTLSIAGVPAADAFTLALIWLAVLLAFLALFLAAFKFAADFMAKRKWKGMEDRFTHFRAHLGAYIAMVLLRTLFIAFFAMTTLALFQFNLRGPPGPKALAGAIVLILTVGMGCIVAYACWFRLRFGRYEAGPDTLRIERGKLFKVIPFISTVRASKLGDKEKAQKPMSQLGWFRIRYVDDDPQRKTVHEDEAYIKRFGWLSAHYRRTRWWFFAYWLGYQFVRACFLGGAVKNPLAQVFGLFVVEVIAFIIIVKLQPFEGQRNMVMAVWFLSIGKVATSGLSIGFLPDFGLSRIVYAVLGIIIIIVQGFLVVAILVLVVLGSISSWMSLSRNREEFPERLEDWRVKYFERMDARAPDLPPPPKPDPKEQKQQKEQQAQLPLRPTFSVRNVQRLSKIEDEYSDAVPDLEELPHNNSGIFSPGVGSLTGRSRANSVSSRHSVSSLPRAARPHRASWSAKDFAAWDAQQAAMERPDSPLAQQARRDSIRRLAHARSQGSLHRGSRSGTPNLLDQRSSSSMALRRPPMTPALEMAEDQVMPATAAGDQSTSEAGSSPEREVGLGLRGGARTASPESSKSFESPREITPIRGNMDSEVTLTEKGEAVEKTETKNGKER